MRKDTGKIVNKYFGFTQVITDDFFYIFIRRSPLQFLGWFLIYFYVFLEFFGVGFGQLCNSSLFLFTEKTRSFTYFVTCFFYNQKDNVFHQFL